MVLYLKLPGFKQWKAALLCTVLDSLLQIKSLYIKFMVTLLDMKVKPQRPGKGNTLIHTKFHVQLKVKPKCFSFQNNYLDPLFWSSMEKSTTSSHKQNHSNVHCLKSETPFILESISYIFQ